MTLRSSYMLLANFLLHQLSLLIPRAHPNVVRMLCLPTPFYSVPVSISVFVALLSLPTPCYSVPASISVFVALSTVFHSINSRDNSVFAFGSSGLASVVLLVLSNYISLYKSLLQP